MFQVVVRLKERVTSEEFHKNTPDTPDITRKTPAQVEDDLRSSVVPCRDHRRMVFIIERGGTEINQPNLAVKEDSSLPSVAGVCVGRGGDGAVVGEGLVVVADKEDIFGLQVGMDEVEVMEN